MSADPTEPDATPDAVPLRRTVTIVNKRGLHARAAAKFVKCVQTFDADITVARLDMRVSGRSIMGLMMLAAAPGCCIEVTAEGRDATAAMDRLTSLIASGFDES